MECVTQIVIYSKCVFPFIFELGQAGENSGPGGKGRTSGAKARRVLNRLRPDSSRALIQNRAFAQPVKFSSEGSRVLTQGLKRVCENSVLEGHGFSRAVNNMALPGFSR